MTKYVYQGFALCIRHAETRLRDTTMGTLGVPAETLKSIAVCRPAFPVISIIVKRVILWHEWRHKIKVQNKLAVSKPRPP